MIEPYDLELRHDGIYSLATSVRVAAAAAFVDDPGTGPLRLAFTLDAVWQPVAVDLRQDGDRVRATVLANPHGADAATVRARLERILSLDGNGAGFDAVGERDPVIASLR